MRPLHTALFGLVLMAAACAGDEDAEQPIDLEACGASCGGQTFVIDEFSFAGPDADGHVPGWDLDGMNSAKDDADGCRTGDFTGPDGQTGVDNQIANLIPALTDEIREALPLLIRNAINEGGLLILPELVGLDDWKNDSLVGVAMRRGAGTPMLGTDDRMLPSQTFELDRPYWIGGEPEAEIVNRRLVGGPFDMDLKIVVFGITYYLTLVEARMDLTLAPDGASFEGYIGGSVHVNDIHGIADTIVVPELGQLVKVLVPPMADIRSADSGECDRISAAAKVHGIRAYVFP